MKDFVFFFFFGNDETKVIEGSWKRADYFLHVMGTIIEHGY